MGLDVVAGGEIAFARAAEFPMERVYMHGNNKSRAELEEAIRSGIGRIVVDNFLDIEQLDAVARSGGRQPGGPAAHHAGRRPAHALPHHHRRYRQQVRPAVD